MRERDRCHCYEGDRTARSNYQAGQRWQGAGLFGTYRSTREHLDLRADPMITQLIGKERHYDNAQWIVRAITSKAEGV